jgi:protein arginine kinase
MRLAEPSVWQMNPGPDADVVVSSRVRLARNIAGFPFVNRATHPQRHEIVRLVQHASFPPEWTAGIRWKNLQQLDPIERSLLVERHLISKQFADGDAPRALALSSDGSLSLMVNEEDHLRMQVLLPGSRLADCFAGVRRLDETLERSLDFAYAQRWGYLTACPTNLGCGIRFSVMLHLPGLKLTGEIEKMRHAAKDLHLAVRGLHGEGSEAIGDFYQVSNQITLGRSEEDIHDLFASTVVPRLVDYERSARAVLLRSNPQLVEDRVHRALGILRSARLLSFEETMKFLSRVRLGICLGRISDVELATVNQLFLHIQPAHLDLLTDLPTPPSQPDPERKATRAALVRRALGARS